MPRNDWMKNKEVFSKINDKNTPAQKGRRQITYREAKREQNAMYYLAGVVAR